MTDPRHELERELEEQSQLKNFRDHMADTLRKGKKKWSEMSETERQKHLKRKSQEIERDHKEARK